ncbi:MAG: sigma-70 family RNA polymerase sigma factor [Marinilabiliaceae bacterium]|nr:sigma-70 family RNA polymerase sigma factor [Marinilabiliaceae bacterium]
MDSNEGFWIDTYNRNVKKLIGICYRYVFDKKIAEDLAHDSFLTAMKKSGTFKGKGHFDAWLRKITVNTALQYLRETKSIQDSQQELLQRELINNDEKMFQKYDFTTHELLEAINKLPEHHRLVFNLYVMDGFTHKQIAEKLDISIGTSKSHLARAKKKLQQILNRKQETKWSLSLLLCPCGFGRINRLYKKKFRNYEIPPQNISFLKTADWTKVKPPRFTLYLSFIKAIVAIGTISILTMIINNNNSNPIDLKSNSDNQKFIDTTTIRADSIPIQESIDSVIQTEPLQKPNPVIIKKKRITHKKVVVRDTLIVLDTTNFE